jgi:predicted transcriptional regulator
MMTATRPNTSKFRKSVRCTNKSNTNKIARWQPSRYIKATNVEIKHIHTTIKKISWSKDAFHKYFKGVENALLCEFRDAINTCYLNQITIPDEWVANTTHQWRTLALIRDFHDYMCGRDKKHYIRTDDCRRFISCAMRGMSSNSFPKPVYRLLCGDSAPRKFIHPQFIKFNSTGIV